MLDLGQLRLLRGAIQLLRRCHRRLLSRGSSRKCVTQLRHQWSQIAQLLSKLRTWLKMNAALSLGKPAPAPGARVAGVGGAGAGRAAHARVALVEQRVDLEQRVARAPLYQLGGGPRGRLVAANAADPGVVGSQRLGQRRDLTDAAAAIGVALVEPRAFAARLLVERERRVAMLDRNAV